MTRTTVLRLNALESRYAPAALSLVLAAPIENEVGMLKETGEAPTRAAASPELAAPIENEEGLLKETAEAPTRAAARPELVLPVEIEAGVTKETAEVPTRTGGVSQGAIAEEEFMASFGSVLGEENFESLYDNDFDGDIDALDMLIFRAQNLPTDVLPPVIEKMEFVVVNPIN